ncbi:dTDP-4-dehydrorhamnose reductase [Scopulibacillus darangshiensis]|uniref:dTDP-4-dehydrorhamnose reductase n=1 Tax=Scopulibacillus darangshiensis TaxID=442528 RepID=A0A4R2NQR5_9BACL|nr:SDR family oxidoreductase [Scopulibacillus darangshiensis]TCP23801.1 dTDP-4-dehydrorhamnose reductase [Scopulibacillus darangshiensis]
MRILVLGGNGMAGHLIANYLSENTNHNILVTSRKKNDANHIFLEATNLSSVHALLSKIKPDIVINCIGILNESASKNIREAILINSALPHGVAKHLEQYGGKLIHISTDCVYSGLKGAYTETDEPDGTSIYARTKALGEIKDSRHLTIRTSIIGPEIKEGIGLFKWFMEQKGSIDGYKDVLWNGVTTLELAKFITKGIEMDAKGLYHLTAPERISKFGLLTLIQTVFSKDDVVIHPVNEPVCNRTLLNTRRDIAYQTPGYLTMIKELKQWIDAS